MNSTFEKNLISTKDASKLSGYTSDYLSRLARSGKIVGKRIGHSWFVDQESLSSFLSNQSGRKVDYARSLARAREDEYRANHPTLNNVAKTLTRQFQVPEKLTRTANTLISNTVAISLSFVVIISGALVARADVIPHIANQIAAAASDVAYGFGETFGDIISHVADRIEKANTNMLAVSSIATKATNAEQKFAGPPVSLLTDFNPSSPHISLAGNYDSQSRAFVPSFASGINTSGSRSSVRNAYAFITNPSRAYVAIGNSAYSTLVSSLSDYRSLIEKSGTKTLTFAAVARDALSDIPRTTVMFIGETGDLFARSTAHVPALAAGFYLRATEVPAIIAPAIAGSVFNAEYAVSARFIKDTQFLTNAYFDALTGTGRLAYNLAKATKVRLPQQLRDFNFRTTIEDTYLAALGKSALALDTFAHTPKVAAVLNSPPALAMRSLGEAWLAIGERMALTTYDAARNLFDFANRAIAILFSPQQTIIVQNAIPKPSVVIASPPASSLQPPVSNSYTTVVQGVSEDFVNQSLASLRSDILATTAGLIRPVYTQTVTNAGTIQMVSKIEDLSNLIVRNGDFRNSIFDNGVRVSATGGNFTNLTGGTTSLGATTVTGDLSLVGSTTLQNFTFANATGTNATTTSLFATTASSTNLFSQAATFGTLSISGLTTFINGFLSNASSTITSGLFTISGGASTTNFTVANNAYFPGSGIWNSSGNVGIGTTSPSATLAVHGNQYTSGTSFFGGALTATSTLGITGAITSTATAANTFPFASTTAITATTASSTNLIASSGVTFQNLIGMLSSNGASGVSARTLTGTANQITVTNGDGTGGNPTFSLPSTLSFTDATSTNFFANRLTANTFSAGQTASTTIDSSGNLATAGTLSVTGQTTLASSLSGLLAGSSGVVYSTATSSLAIGSSLSNSGTLGSQIGGTASSLSLNMANSNWWTALQNFTNASTSQFTATSSVYLATANGSVGIATTSPSATLAVHGNGLFSGNVSLSGLTATGTVAVNSAARTSGASALLSLTGGSDTSLTASTEAPDIQFNLARIKTHSNGTITLQRDALINAATHAFTNLAGGLITDLATLGVTGAPLLGTNATSTNSHTLYLGASALNASTTNSYGLTVNSNTGATNNYAAAFLGGSVGIGTTSPSATLAVHGNGLLSGNLSVAGITATSSISAASLALTTALPVSSGGTGWAAVQSGAVPYGNGSSALATTTAGTPGYVLALNGITPTWVATTTFSSGLSYSAGNVTNTGVLSLGVTGTALTGALTVA
ncbi:hypothetical protein HY412_01820, partial [Candidatus Kaiserbacteria bacterium]|nr:hypothetical protein [Candidatus Kaiserbacteria bacterium]